MLYEKVDVLVIGGGIAGAIAALEVSKSYSVMMISKDRVMGGASIQASGGMAIPGIAGEDLSVFVEDTLKGGEYINDRSLVKIFAEEGASYITYLEELGMVFDQDKEGKYRIYKRTEGHSAMRNYNDRRGCHEVGRVFKEKLVKSNVKLMEHTMVYDMKSVDGRIAACSAYSLKDGKIIHIAPKAVIMASGGYGRIYSVSDMSTGLTGECHGMALDCGAELMDMEMVQFIPLAFPFPEGMRGAFIGMCSIHGPDVRLYNSLGERFMERYQPDRKEYATRDQVARAIFTEIRDGRGTERGGVIVDTTNNDKSLLPRYKASTAAVYSALARVFGEKAANWEEPFEAAPSQHFCMGGIKIDGDCRTACKNLFAAGEITGGIHGANRLGGNALTEVTVFGKLAGKSVCKEVAEADWAKESDLEQYFAEQDAMVKDLFVKKGGVSGTQIKKALGEIMWECGGIVRIQEMIEKGLAQLAELKKEAETMHAEEGDIWNYSLVEALEVKHMLKVSEAVLLSASMRKESRGSHYREDYPAKDEAYMSNMVIVQKEGKLVCEKRPIIL
ncbi:MAG: FAD-dependent oxidoreductase [Peptococcaceae bacterium]|nr:FAD-dependent oxidoreductase [Peptococcaceae bacterium]